MIQKLSLNAALYMDSGLIYMNYIDIATWYGTHFNHQYRIRINLHYFTMSCNYSTPL